MTLNLRKEGKISRYTDKIDSISIRQIGGEEQKEEELYEIQSESEVQVLQELIKITKKIDPDFIFTEDGDIYYISFIIRE